MSDNSRQQWRGPYLDGAHLFVPVQLRQEAAVLARAENVVNAALMAAIAGPGYALAYWLPGLELAAFEILACCFIMLLAPPLLRLSGSIVAARDLFLCALFFNFTWLTWHLGGIRAPTASWLVTAPVLAMFLGGVASGVFWLAMSCAAVGAIWTCLPARCRPPRSRPCSRASSRQRPSCPHKAICHQNPEDAMRIETLPELIPAAPRDTGLDAAPPDLPALAASGALGGSVALYRQPRGPDLLRRSGALEEWCQLRMRHGVWPYARKLDGPPAAMATVEGDGLLPSRGINFASQDYLSLASHPAVQEAAMRALAECGPHSAGSAILLGNSRHTCALERALGELLHCEHTVLFPTGWGAAFGAITALVHSADHVLIDSLAHASLRQGAAAATRNVAAFRHLDCDHVRELLAGIRAIDTGGAILVVTEGLFSMDADSPDLPLMQYLCREYGATLLVDVAHDLGAMGPGGGGIIAAQGMLGKIDLVMGAFSKTFASNGGFVACAQQSVRRQLQLFAGTHMFSNALSPVQAATVLECLRIAGSLEGDGLRAAVLRNAVELRALLAGEGLKCIGDPSPIVPVWTGLESATRIAGMLLAREQVFVNPMEFPGVPLGAARLRLQLMAQHTPGQIRRAARLLVSAVQRANMAPRPVLRQTAPA